MQNSEPSFQYDVLIDRINFCDRAEEIHKINLMVERNKKIVLYAPRRYGKTSLMKNIISDDFYKKHNNSLAFYVNFMGVDDLEDIAKRISNSLTRALEDNYPVKTLFNNMVAYLKGLSLVINLDSLTGMPSIEIKPIYENKTKELQKLLNYILKISEKYKILLILDEFQDVDRVPQATALLRTELQEFVKIPIAMLGSKRQLLTKMFASKHSPFFSFGDEITLTKISHDDWVPYFNARLKKHKLSINQDAVVYLCNILNNVPNAICEVGAWLVDNLSNTKITPELVGVQIQNLINNKQESFLSQISFLTINEKSVLREIAKVGYVKEINSKRFLNKIRPTQSVVSKIVNKLSEKGLLEFEYNSGYRVSDPLLGIFLSRF